MTNRDLLRGKIVAAGHTHASFARAMGMGLSTLSAKMNNHRPFDSDEIIRACEVLRVSEDREKIQIFLSPASQFRDNKAG